MDTPAADPSAVLPAAPEKKRWFAKKKAVAKPGTADRHSGIGGAMNHFGLGKERTAFIQNIAMLLDAGLPLVDAIKTLERETRIKPFKKMLNEMRTDVESGEPLWRAMDRQAFFSQYAIALTRIGEEAGSLAQNMQYLATQDEKDSELRGKVKMAMIYPAIVLVLVFVVVVGIGGFVLPNLIPVLISLNAPLPLVTRILIAFSNFFTAHWAVAMPSFFAVIFFFILLHVYTRFKLVTQWVIFRIPGIGRLAREATIARFGVILGGLLQAGVPLIDSIKSLVDVTTIAVYKNFYADMLGKISLGETFQKTFASVKNSETLLPVTVQELVTVGEQSGRLATTLLKISDIYDRKAEETAQKLPVILEPILLLFMGGLVGTIAFAIIIPIYSVVGNIGH